MKYAQGTRRSNVELDGFIIFFALLSVSSIENKLYEKDGISIVLFFFFSDSAQATTTHQITSL